MNRKRRQLLQAIGIALLCAPCRILQSQQSDSVPHERRDNFRSIYANPAYRSEFKSFLSNVFHLYPEDELHALIEAGAAAHAADRDVYLSLQPRLDEIKPLLGDLTYALPALAKQKAVLAEQSLRLVDTGRRYENYLEVGSNGRYLDSLEEGLDIVGERFVVSERAPGYSLIDILDRGQIFKAGAYIPLDDYRTNLAGMIAPNSIELATVFIGFHHCPLPLRESFFAAIRDAMKPGGRLIVRDHNVHDDKMWKMVALAHDVFNMGTRETWDYNQRELRHFYSLDRLDVMLERAGFSGDGRRLFQDGDPTLNALMVYRKR